MISTIPGLEGPPPCPERLLIIDTETTGLTPQEGQCIEVGAILFHVPTRSVLSQLSFLLPCDENPAQAVNGIAPAITHLDSSWAESLECFHSLEHNADALVAHSAAFDRQWFGIDPLPEMTRPWICSKDDIRWPADRRLRPAPSLAELALACEVPVWAAHRALTDCTYLAQVFQRCDDFEVLLQAALESRSLVKAVVSFDERELAKAAGFRWNEPVAKAWTRRLSAREIAELPFPVVPCKEP